MPALRKLPSKILCWSTLSTMSRRDEFKRTSHSTAPGWKTTCCPYTLPNKSSVTGLVTGFKHQIKDPVNCETRNCIYYLIILDTPDWNYNQSGQNLSYLAGLVLEEVINSDPFLWKARKFVYIQQFDTFTNGLNKEL